MNLYNTIDKNLRQRIGYFDIFTLGILFFLWGFLTQLNDILVPHLYALGLTYQQSIFLHFTFYGTYLLIAFPASKYIDMFGFKKGILLGLVLIFIGCCIFFGVNDVDYYLYYNIALFVIASGITFLQIAANGYIVLQSVPRKAASNLSFAQSFNSFGRIFTVFLGGYLIFLLTDINIEDILNYSPKEIKSSQIDIIKLPYFFMACFTAVAFILIYTSKLPNLNAGNFPLLIKSNKENVDSIFKVKHLLLGSLAIFVYVGAEVSIGSNLVNYIQTFNSDTLKISDKDLLNLVNYYWGSAFIGRIVGGFVMRDLSPRYVIATFAFFAALFVLISIFGVGQISVVSIVIVGFFNSILFPAIFTMGINGLGHFVEEGASVLISSIVGGAIIPLIFITLAESIGLKWALFLPVLCYIYIIYFGLQGSKFDKISDNEIDPKIYQE